MREQLLDLLQQGREKANKLCGEQNGCEKCPYQAPKGCAFGIIADHLIANNVVPVVRCKDCKHRYTTFRGLSFCTQHLTMSAKDDDFCSYGERKDNG